jgi:hypothetical protein
MDPAPAERQGAGEHGFNSRGAPLLTPQDLRDRAARAKAASTSFREPSEAAREFNEALDAKTCMHKMPNEQREPWDCFGCTAETFDEQIREIEIGNVVRSAAQGWLVWSAEHGCWWRANRCGYTGAEREAGRYSLKEAAAICKLRQYKPKGADRYRPSEVMVPSPELLARLAGDRDACPSCGGDPAAFCCAAVAR